MGGLACAIDLARYGFEVTVLERSARSGGKMREEALGPVRLDAGPTVLTMRWVFDNLFEAAGASLDAHIRLRSAEVIARHAWSGGAMLDLFSDVDRSADAVAVFAGAREALGYRAFCAEAGRIHDTLRDSFLFAQQTGPLGLAARVGPGRAAEMLGLRPFSTLWDALGDHFRDPRLRQLFGRYATYCGSSPFAAPATLMLVAHVERLGVWTVEGGMQRLAEALQALALRLGVSFRFSTPVARIDLGQGRVSGVTLADGERLPAGAVVVNADAQALASGLFGRSVAGATPAIAPARRSLSALTWSMVARTRGFPLTRHNVFFSDDYLAEFTDILRNDRPPRAPTVYICAQDRLDDGAGPGEPERLFAIVNAPANGDRRGLDEAEISACETHLFAHLASCGLTVESVGRHTRITTPTDFNIMFPGTGGALYGPATHGWAAAFQRPGARTKVPGLYLAGGWAHPGAGVPMAALSGRLAAQKLAADRVSTHPFRRAATSGGISTP